MPTPTPQTLWQRTYRRDSLSGMSDVSIRTAVDNDDTGRGWICADLEYRARSANVIACVELEMTPDQMRGLAALLHLHADRIERELQPLLDEAAAGERVQLRRLTMVADIAMMHGRDWQGEGLAGWTIAEKFDGCRLYWDGAAAWTRGGNVIALPGWITLPAGIALDCELYAGIGRRQACANAVRYGRFTPDMILIAFDAPGQTGNVIERLRTAAAASIGHRVTFARHTTAISTEHALQEMRGIQARGGEGLMAMSPDTPYQPGRTGALLKLKYDIAERIAA